MKASKAITISLAAVLTACAIPFGTVFAAAEENAATVYPQDFERNLEIEALTDYAVFGDRFAYASNSTITIISGDDSGDRKCVSYTHEYLITALDYDKDGNLFFKTSSEISYMYGATVTQKEHSFQDTENLSPVITDTGFYTLVKETGSLQFWKEGSPTDIGEGYSLIKKYGGYVYAIKDGTAPYRIEENTATALDLSYTDFSGADKILCGDAAANLKASGYQVKTANIKRGTYYTQIDPAAIGSEETFTQIRTQKNEGDKPCIILCTTGNASIVATNDGMFITATENIKDSAYSSPKNDWPLNADGSKRLEAYAIADVGVYASPYMCESTRIATLESGAENHVEVIEKFELDYIKTKFYRVRYTDKQTGDTVSGFVAANMLTQYDYRADDKVPAESGDKEFKYDTNVVSVVLAIVIVALVIVAIMYIALIGTKKDRLQKEKKVKEKPAPEQVEDSDEDE